MLFYRKGSDGHVKNRQNNGLIRRLAAGAAVALVVCGAGPRDRTPPVFAGLRSATTCVPGPVGTHRTSSYRLTWRAARDDRTAARLIRYDVYRSSRRGGERYTAPTYTIRGVTVFVTPPLSADASYYFVVRARDTAGNRDRNRRERLAVNVCM